MHVRANFVPLVLAMKERAAFTDDLLLAALPAGPRRISTCFVDKARELRAVAGAPGADAPEAQHLWDAMLAALRRGTESAP
jgi:hypothetical protein